MAVSTAELEKYLKGMDYPARKDDLMQKARDNHAPHDVIDLIERLPDQDFHSPVDVNKAVGKLK